ncbi:pectinesterase 3-like [Dioscorea cayenensis subsp. rotundata]|uniref:Pectinesterase n=1 Tax=Dioscorea cayennensis subsp. rotundata TaxID=55577 RepID=A0AB40D0F2_DIOCR|nr:pectinesterase 3-like [Dioscorea cayenensis subsp. rotundata]
MYIYILTVMFSNKTVAVGRRFMAKGISFKNTAGPDKHQAVALRAGSDQSVFYKCSFDGYQDTLYAHSLRQFYRDCDITGTIDFIFGNAAVVFQSCNIKPRQPLPNQSNTITAQGRTDPNQNTGISIQSSTISALDSLTRPTYLGRPWKPYSTTIIMKTEISAVVDPSGWMPWVAGTVPPETIMYAEYDNTGPGAAVAGRVKWPGYQSSVSDNVAQKFSVASFIAGDEWLPDSGVEFVSTLT